jgi:hypothetical protein
MSSKKKCLLCEAENEHDAESCHLCGHTEFESIEEPQPEPEEDPSEFEVDPTEGDPSEFEVDVESDPVFCSYLKDNNELCRAKKPSPCGRHDSDKQIQQEVKLKEMVVEAFNKTQGANYSVSDLGLPEDASAFDFLCAVFYYLDVNADRMHYSPYIGLPLTAENRHDHRKVECWNQSTYDHSYHCKYCTATSTQPPWMAGGAITGTSSGGTGSAGPQMVNYITNHSKLKAESTGLKAQGQVGSQERPDCFVEGLWEHYWVMRYKDEAKTQVLGRYCQHCNIAFTLNPNRDT